MFTGIIEEVGRVERVLDPGGGRRISIRTSFGAELHEDQSISVNGACLTVVEVRGDVFDVVAVEETLAKTTLGSAAHGSRVNLERAVRMGERLDGHLVQGHVDTVGEVTGVEIRASSRVVEVRFDPRFAPYVIPTGSIALDGISLTTASVAGDHVTVSIIPYTLEHTNTRFWQRGTRVNVEFDMVGKYVLRRMERQGEAPSTAGLTEEWLRVRGF